jgi:hypothetical protein
MRCRSITWLGLPAALALVFTLVAWLLSGLLAAPLVLPSWSIAVLPILVFLGFIPQWAAVMLQLADRPIAFAAYEIVTASLQLLGALLLVVVFGMGWEGRLWSMILGGVLATAMGLRLMRPYLALGCPRRVDLVETVKFGAGLLPHTVFSQAIRMADRLFVLHFAGIAAAGEFVVGWQVASVMLLLLSAFNQAWAPYLFKCLSRVDEARKRALVRLSYLIAVAFVGLYLAVNAVAPWVFSTMIAPQFHGAQRFVPFITLGYLFLGLYMLFTDYIFYMKKTHIFSIVTTVNALVNIGLNYLLVERYGDIGVAYAFVISNALSMVATAVLAHRVYPMPWFGGIGLFRSV